MNKTLREERIAFMRRIGMALFLAAFVCCFFQAFSINAEAKITREKSGYSLTMTGTNETIIEADEYASHAFSRRYDLKIKENQNGNDCNYKVKFTITFPSLALTPDQVDVWLLNNHVTIEKGRSRTLTCSFDYKYSTVGSNEQLRLDMIYDNEFVEEEDDIYGKLPVKFNFKLEVQHKSADVYMKVYSSTVKDTLYPSNKGTFSVDILDPTESEVKASKVKVTSSNKSVVKVTKKKLEWSGSSSVEVTLKALKTGTSKITVTYKNKKATFSVKVKKHFAYLISSGSETLTVGNRVSIFNYIKSSGSAKVKNLKSSKPSVVSVSGRNLYARKTGSSTISFTLNGKKQKFTIAVVKKLPTLKELNVRYIGYDYYPYTLKLYYTVQLTNNSSYTITKVNLRLSGTVYEDISQTKTVTVNLKPGSSKRYSVYMGRMIDVPSEPGAVCTKFWYK